MKTRVIVANDHKLFVEALQRLLEPHFDIVGTATDGTSLLERAQVLHPDAAVIDLAMPPMNGLDAARKLKQILPRIKLIFLTMNQDPDLAIRAMREGASAYLLKTSAAAELVQAIDAAMKGERYVTPKITRGMHEALIQNPGGKEKRAVLTPRQQQVLQLLAEGKSMKEAAAVLGVTPRTIAFHKYRVMEELRLKNTAELIKFAVQSHLVAA